MSTDVDTVWETDVAPVLGELSRIRYDLYFLEKRNAEEDRLQDVQHEHAEARGDAEAQYSHVQAEKDKLYSNPTEIAWTLERIQLVQQLAERTLPLFQQLFADFRAALGDIDDPKIQALLEEYIVSDTAEIRLYHDPRDPESEIGDQWRTAQRVFDEIPDEATAAYTTLCTLIDETLSAMSQLVYQSTIDAEERRKMLYELANSRSVRNASTRLQGILERQQVQYVIAERNELSEMFRSIMKTSDSDEELSKAEDTWIRVAQADGRHAFDDDVEELRTARSIFDGILNGNAFES